MNAYVIWAHRGPILVLTKADSPHDAEFARRLAEKGIERFLATPVPVELVKERYGEHYRLVVEDRYQTDLLRVVDEDGDRVVQNFAISELGAPEMHQAA